MSKSKWVGCLAPFFLALGCGGRQVEAPGGDAGAITDATSVDVSLDRGAPDGGTPYDAGFGLPPSCKSQTCALLNANCGQVSDGCGAVLDCGTCVAPQCCGGGGFNQCGGPSDAGQRLHDDAGTCSTCTPLTCAQQKVACGPASDGCGNLLQCGTCTGSQTCGGDGIPGQCGGR